MTQEVPSKPPRKPRKPLVLTQMDLRILQGIADGETAASLARELCEPFWRVRYRLVFMRKVLPSKNLFNLIAEAIRKGHID